jgi:uncharacterized protein
MMIIKIAGLSEGLHSYRFREPVEKFNLTSPFTGELNIEVELNKTYNQVILNVNLKINAIFECDRCVTDFTQELNPVYQVVYMFGNIAESDDINVVYLPADADKINIAPEVRDYALLAVPMKKLCNDSCKGLCPKCGRNLNEGTCTCDPVDIDSRWLPLQELKKINNN